MASAPGPSNAPGLRRCRWEALRTVLQQIVGVGGDMAAYRILWEQGRWWWLSGANQTVHAGPNLDMTCNLARKTGLLIN